MLHCVLWPPASKTRGVVSRTFDPSPISPNPRGGGPPGAVRTLAPDFLNRGG